jgi:hypothetical protein
VTEVQWGQATRPISFAGLGLRSTAQHAEAAYMASRTQTADICKELDASFSCDMSDAASALARALASLNSRFPVEEPGPALKWPPRYLSNTLDQGAPRTFFNSLPPDDQADIQSERLLGASVLLGAIPSKSLGVGFEPKALFQKSAIASCATFSQKNPGVPFAMRCWGRQGVPPPLCSQSGWPFRGRSWLAPCTREVWSLATVP